MTYISGYSLDRLRGFNGGAHHTRIAGVVTQRGYYCCLLLWIPDIIKHPEYPSFRANAHRCDLCFSLRGAIAPPLCDSPSVYGNRIRVQNPVYIDMCIFWVPPCRAWPRFYEGSLAARTSERTKTAFNSYIIHVWGILFCTHSRLSGRGVSSRAT